MESSSPISALIQGSFKSWLTALKSVVESCRNESKEVFIIAISRKMPRVFKWIQSPYSRYCLGLTEDEHKEYADFIDKCRITTEYALPFLFTKERDKDSYEVIVVDDIIIRGITLRQVSCDVAAMTGKKSIASAIFKCEGIGLFEYADTSRIDGMPSLTPDQRKEAVDFIAKCIMSSSLPVDLVYPILNQSRSFECLSKRLEKNSSGIDWKCYDVNTDLAENGQASEQMNESSINRHTQTRENIKSLSVLINGDARKFCNNDFSKIRLFDKENGECTLAIYSPNIISADVLKDGTPFNDEKYIEVWSEVRDSSRDYSCSSYAGFTDFIDLAIAKRRIANRCLLSYGAWANFLLSISMFNRIDKETSLFKGIEMDKTLCLEDIALLLGHDLASAILPKVNKLLKDGSVASYLIETVSVNDLLSPDESREKYDEERKKLVYGKNDLNHTLEALFELQQILSDDDVESRGLGETFNSLHNCIALYFQDEAHDLEIEINHYIDKAIDCGKISAFYAEVPNFAGDMFVKRFFRFGSNSVL